MTNSREKFEAWIATRKGEYDYYDCWLAGRESMRDEALTACEEKSIGFIHTRLAFNAIRECEKAIKEIQL